MSLPSSAVLGIEGVMEEALGRPARITSSTPVSGGCINSGARIEADSGDVFFLKWNPGSPREMFEAEADGLQALAMPTSLRVPTVVGWGGAGSAPDPAWLLMEFIPKGRAGSEFGRLLGEGLAEVHGSAAAGGSMGAPTFGWHRDNFIGSLPQANGPAPGWTDFWRDRRLAPQLRMARENGHFKGAGGRTLDRLLDQLEAVMDGADEHGPALLHGDLWSGNYYPGPKGEPVLIDPAAYRGVGEVDLAMMELFGGLPRGFLDGYESRRPLAQAYKAFRRDLYQLYYLLVHVNLFGSGYVNSSVAAAERALDGSSTIP